MRGDTLFHRLPDGRRLAYAEYGDPQGTPVVLVHGIPGSRLFWGRLPDSPFRSGLRLIAPDRPGVGLSDFGRGRSVADWPEDVASLADALAIEKFIIFGPSGGGPYVLACAWKLPHRVAAAGVFAPLGPYLPETIDGLVPSLAKLYRIAPRFPRFIRLQMALSFVMGVDVFGLNRISGLPRGKPFEGLDSGEEARLQPTWSHGGVGRGAAAGFKLLLTNRRLLTGSSLTSWYLLEIPLDRIRLVETKARRWGPAALRFHLLEGPRAYRDVTLANEGKRIRLERALTELGLSVSPGVAGSTL